MLLIGSCNIDWFGSGFVDSNFQNVRAAFEKQFLNGQEVGAQLVAFIDGTKKKKKKQQFVGVFLKICV